MKKFVSALAVLALVGGATLTGCKEASHDGKGVVSAVDTTTKTVTIDETQYTLANELEWPADIATSDSVSYTYAGTTISAISKISSPIQAAMDSTGAALDSAGAAIGAAADSVAAGAADALQGAAAAIDSTVKH